jgi:cytochrome b561
MHKGYSTLQIGLHWTIAGLILANWLLSGAMESAYRDLLEDVVGATTLAAIAHIVIGLTVLALILARMSLKLRRPVEPAPEPQVWMKTAATINHWLFYITLIALPMTGFIAWFAKAEGAGNAHGNLFNILLVIAALHIGAALYHQFALRDRLIRRMMRANTQAEPPQGSSMR